MKNGRWTGIVLACFSTEVRIPSEAISQASLAAGLAGASRCAVLASPGAGERVLHGTLVATGLLVVLAALARPAAVAGGARALGHGQGDGEEQKHDLESTHGSTFNLEVGWISKNERRTRTRTSPL